MEKNEWRCAVCNRLLCYLLDNGDLKIMTLTKQVIVVNFKEREVICKCGSRIFIGENILKITFRGVLSTG